MKGMLKGSDGTVFHLLPKVTTIGRDGCNLTIQSNTVDIQHAVIEYNDQKESFVLQDLDTSFGTSVNQCLVKNVGVRLQPGDIMKFGSHPVAYEFCSDNKNTHVCPPCHSRSAWSSATAADVREGTSVPCGHSQSSSKPGCPLRLNATTMGSRSKLSVSPHPPENPKMRSVGDGLRRNTQDLALQSIPNHESNDPGVCLNQSSVGKQSDSHVERLQQHLKVLMEELKLLTGVEMDSHRKDDLISQLQGEIGILEKRLFRTEVSDASLTEVKLKLGLLEKEMVREKMETKSIKSQLNQMKPIVSVTTSPYHINCANSLAKPASVSRNLQNIKPRPPSVLMGMESNDAKSLQAEIERLKKDKSAILGHLTQIQAETANKDLSISHLSKQIDELKREISLKDTNIASLKTKIQLSIDAKADKDALEFKDREIALLQYKLKLANNQKLELNNQLISAKKNLIVAQTSSGAAKQQMEVAKSEAETLKNKNKDLEHAEHLVRVAMEQISKRLELLRNRVIQAVFICSGSSLPERHFDDEELFAALRKFSEQYSGLQKHNTLLQSKQEIENTIAENAEKLKQELMSATSRLKVKGQHPRHLQAEIERIRALPVTENFLSDIRDAFVSHLQMAHKWEKEIENAIDKCSIDYINIVPSKRISELHSKLQEALAEVENLKIQSSQSADRIESQIKEEASRRLVDLETKYKDEIKQIRHEEGLRLIQAVTDAQKVNQDIVANLVKVERERTEELEKLVAILRQSLKESEDRHESMRIQAMNAGENLDAYKKNEAELKASLERVKMEHAVEIKALVKSTQKLNRIQEKLENERKQLMEEIKNHVSSLCSLEERLNVAVKKYEDYQIENEQLKTKITELETKLRESVAPSALTPVILQPVVDEAAMEHLIRENRELKRTVHEQQNAVVSLRRDLAGANSRLSDVAAELSEAKKVELENGNQRIKEQEEELVSMHQRMAQLSEIVDKQTIEIRELRANIRKEKELASQYKDEISKKNAELGELRGVATKNQKKTVSEESTKLQEDKVRNEMQSLGVQCKGERHLQTIERQREALVELRAHIKTLTGLNTELQIPTTLDEALKQLIVLQKEFECIRAKQPTPTQNASDTEEKSSSSQSTDCAGINRSRLIDLASKAHLDMEKSAHYETQECLDYSEQSYLALVRTVSDALGMDRGSLFKSIANLSPEDIKCVMAERRSNEEKISKELNVLKNRLERKDGLLNGYEGDLLRFREAHDFAASRSKSAESLADEVRILNEEVDYLRNALSRMRSQLDQEKRLNTNIKQRKTFHLESEFTLKDGWPQHHCLQEGDAKMVSKKPQHKNLQRERKQDIGEKKNKGSEFRPMDEDSDFKLIAVDT